MSVPAVPVAAVPTPSTAARPVCSDCLRPARTCICHWVRPVDNAVAVLILQHPLEVTQTKGSARLLHLSLQRSRLAVGEVFDDALLRDWLGDAPGSAVLLYPETPSLPAVAGLPARPGPDAVAPQRLVVLDGTWRKSLRLLALNPRLQALPRLALAASFASPYGQIRRARRPDQLSTLEATCLALQQVEAAPALRYAPLLAAFDGFVAEQAARAPARIR